MPMTRVLACLIALAMTSVACLAQRTLLRVDDLVTARKSFTDWRIPLSPGPDWGDEAEDLFSFPGHWNTPQLLGVTALAREPVPPLSPELLESLLESWMETDTLELSNVAGYLLVDIEEAPRVRGALDQLRTWLAAESILLDLRLEERHKDGWRLLSSGTARSVAGSACRLGDITHRSMLTGWNVEISGTSSIGDPVVRKIIAGAAVLLRARRVPGRGQAVLELVARQRAFDEPEMIELRSNQLSDLERVSMRQSQAGFTSLLARGVAKQFLWAGAGGRELRLTVRADWPEKKATKWQPGFLKPLLLSSLLRAPVADFRFLHSPGLEYRWAEGGDDEDLVPGSPQQELLGELLDSEQLTDLDHRIDSSLRALFVGPKDESRHALVMELVDRLSRPVPIEIDVYSAPGSSGEPDAGSIPPDARRLASIRTTLLEDRWSSFSGAQLRSYIGDWSVEIAGGGGRIGDPETNFIRGGYWCALKAARRSPSGAVTLDLDLRLQDSSWLEPILVKMANARISAGWVRPAVRIPKSNGASETVLPERRSWSILEQEECGILERPILATKGISRQLELEPGKPQLLRSSAPGLRQPGLLIVVKVPKS